MQNFIITFILFLLSLFVSAQEVPEKFTIEKGTWSLEGAFNINGSNSEYPSAEYKNFGFSIRPSAAYFFNDNLSAGVFLGYNYHRNQFADTDEFQNSKSSGFIIAPYLQKYFAVSEAFALSLNGSLEYRWSKSNNETDNCLNCSEYISKNYTVAVRPGISYLLSDKFSLDTNFGLLGYTYSEREDEDGIENIGNSFNFYLNLSSIYLGLTYYFN